MPRDMCAGNTIPGETYITVTPVLILWYVYMQSVWNHRIAAIPVKAWIIYRIYDPWLLVKAYEL